ncbi:MAG: hypothetical protein NC898_03690 [Candidatus Omnitrophica bacterium]|nr:hypothetical protein [Candidatus Omnitrophota bacterium]MCM8793553.1 hypothetical protein [Candidatus Omnitrophota bacterium]
MKKIGLILGMVVIFGLISDSYCFIGINSIGGNSGNWDMPVLKDINWDNILPKTNPEIFYPENYPKPEISYPEPEGESPIIIDDLPSDWEWKPIPLKRFSRRH